MSVVTWKGPAALLASWVIHDVEEAFAFPSTCDDLADRTGIEAIRMTPAQSWLAVGLMGILVGAACYRGLRTAGRSRLYRATLAGLQAHVATHLGASIAMRQYTAGVATAVPVMLPGVLIASRELHRSNRPLTLRDYLSGGALLIPAAVACQGLARTLLNGPRR